MSLPTIQDKMQSQMIRINDKLSRVKYKIAVLSGKGGVGKTTIAVNLACTLAKNYSVGILDADIDCPNVGKILGIEEKFEMRERKLIPKEKYGIKIISTSFFADEDKPMIWRGPMIHNTILQFLELADYGDIEYLIIDMPPGTSDAALTAMQLLPLDFVVIVTTSQQLSLMDAKKSSNMAKQFNKPMALIENMSGNVFGRDKGKELAEELGIPFLGSIELSEEIAVSEGGIPLVLKNKDFADKFQDIANHLNTLVKK